MSIENDVASLWREIFKIDQTKAFMSNNQVLDHISLHWRVYWSEWAASGSTYGRGKFVRQVTEFMNKCPAIQRRTSPHEFIRNWDTKKLTCPSCNKGEGQGTVSYCDDHSRLYLILT